jgi:hypothetical protein
MYEITQEYAALDAALAEAEDAGHGPESAEVAAIVTRWFSSGLEGVLAEKIGKCLLIVQEQRALCDVANAESARLHHLAYRRGARADRVLDAVHAAMLATHTKRVETPLGVVSVQGNGGNPPLIVDDVDPDVIALEYPELVKTTTTIVKSAVGDALRMGGEVPWARFGVRGTHLVIR